jgi:hypothetical protein
MNTTTTSADNTTTSEKTDIYHECQFTNRIMVDMVNISDAVLLSAVRDKFEGHCSEVGYIKKGSIKILSQSSPVLRGSRLEYAVLLNAQVCNPVADQLLKIRVLSNITSSGIRGVSADVDASEPSPFIVYIYRDHHYQNEAFSKIAEGDIINTKVLYQQFELNDPEITVVGEIV